MRGMLSSCGKAATVITLTAVQMDEARKTGDVTLTAEQRRRLQHACGFAPQRLAVYSLQDAKADCTCQLLNIGIAFEPGKLEVPHAYAAADLDARFRTAAPASTTAPESDGRRF